MRIRHVWSLSILLTCATVAGEHCIAQNSTADGVLGVAVNGPSDSPIEEPRSLVEVRASNESSKATIRVGRTKSHAAQGAGAGEPVPSVFSAWSLTAEAPISKGTTTTDLATLDGLGNATTLSLKFNRFRATRRRPDPDRLDAVCDRLEKKKSGAVCDADNIQKYLPPTDQREFRTLFWDDGKPRFFYGFTATGGHETFESFTDTTSTTKAKKTESPWSIGSHVGWLFRKYGLLTIGYRYEEAYEAQTPVSRCAPIAGSPNVTCVSSAAGAPKEKAGAVSYLEWRRQVSFAAVSARLSHDSRKDVTGVDVPVYVWSGNDGKLNGGLRLGWRDDTDDVVVGIFVGSTFKLFD